MNYSVSVVEVILTIGIPSYPVCLVNEYILPLLVTRLPSP